MRSLKEEVSYTSVGLFTMDIMNETHFIKNVEKTPSFLLFEKKGGYFWDLGTSDFDEIVKTVKRVHKQR